MSGTLAHGYGISSFRSAFGVSDIDRDYKNEVIAAASSSTHCVYAFDGLDNDNDGEGDLVWSPYCVDDAITDVEVGDLDGDGDDDGKVNGVIVDDGGPGVPRAPAGGVGGEAYPVNKIYVLAP